MKSPSPVHISRHIGVTGYRELEPEWLRLAAETATHFLHHPAWYGAKLLACEDDPESVVFLAFRQEDRLISVVPLMHRFKTLARSGLALTYSLWEIYYPNEMGLCDISLDNRFAGTAPLVDALTRELDRYRRWDLLEVPHLPQGSPFLALLSRSRCFFTKPSHVSKYLVIEGDYDTFMARYPKKFHRNLRRKLNNLEGKGKVRFEYVTEREILERAFDDFLRVEDSGWKGRDGTSILRQPLVLDYYRRLVAGYDQPGQVVIHLLWLNGNCIGGQFALQAGTTLSLLKIGYDENYSAESPGFLLVDQLIREACGREGIGRISFVTGTQWMDVWKPWEEPVYNAYHFNRTLKGLLLSLAMRLFERLKPYLPPRSQPES
ncbi:MAG: GNAT family N-acetyltransferase [Gammaproteobacteria bacterium]|nr:GNAT family N-acetyltransferase [Gammaproteobacteria bacterium]MBU1655988.1 GNAT family N-acetyltransferase [Gammaproteobacteria bacterium]MBU1962572.1 GNAT family N-acetyltransferase [Gammaproteobacteria bacterium]